jgi:glycosyltransferase involved in cell wall biosynthesis
MPKITVLMPVYNAEKYLREAIESILKQTFTDFEFLIVDDGSTDNSLTIARTYQDQRIKILQNEKNLGLIATLNKGLQIAQGEYIARMDADDISLPRRLELQSRFMDAHPNVGVCGTWTKTFGESEYVNKYSSDSDTIKATFLFRTDLAHPTAMLRAALFQKNNWYYDEAYSHAEDYELWTRISPHTDFANIPKVSLFYRVHKQSVSIQYRETQVINSNKVKLNKLKELHITPDNQELKLIRRLHKPDTMEIMDFIQKMEAWLLKLKTANQKYGIFKKDIFARTIANRWLEICYTNAHSGKNVWKYFWQSKLGNFSDYNKKTLLKFYLKRIFST